MGLLIFLQVIFDLAFIAIATLLLIERSKSKTMEDPRLSRGLQLLSSKIAILQDLMDKSEGTARQLTQLIDGKQQDIQERLEEAEVHLHKIRKATEKSEEVAKIFQDQIPHEEIIEKQTTAKYVQAAKMAHKGMSVEEIARQIDIPRGELELIVKVNRERAVFEQPRTEAQPETKIEQQLKVEPLVETETLPFTAKVANDGNRESQVRPVVFKRIDELGLQK